MLLLYRYREWARDYWSAMTGLPTIVGLTDIATAILGLFVWPFEFLFGRWV